MSLQNVKFYASDKQVLKLSSRDFGLKGIKHIFVKDEVLEKHSGLAWECDWILASLIKNLEIKANIKFVILEWPKPFSVVKIDNNEFVVFIGLRASNSLLTLGNRLVTLPPLSNITNSPTINERRNFREKFLLDITKDITFRPIDLGTQRLDDGLEVSRAALYFIISHEVAHIIKGHFEFKKSHDYSKFRSTDDDEFLTLKAFEMDADKLATSNVCSYFEEYSDWKISQIKTPFESEKLKNQYRQMYLLGLYVALIYQDTLTTNFIPKKYPITYARFITIVIEMRYLFKKHYPESYNLIDETRKALIDCFINLSGDVKYLGHPMAANFIINPGEENAEYRYSAVGEAGAFEILQPLWNRLSELKPYLVQYYKSEILIELHKNPDLYPPKSKID